MNPLRLFRWLFVTFPDRVIQGHVTAALGAVWERIEPADIDIDEPVPYYLTCSEPLPPLHEIQANLDAAQRDLDLALWELEFSPDGAA